jgi:RNA polymerase-binding transcription factor
MTCHVARRVGEFMRRLRRDRRETRHALLTTDAELVGYTREHPGDFLDDAATDTTVRLLARLEERDRRVLEEIDAAEDRVANGTFGICETCATAIPFERLQALPEARLCITCEEAAERAMRRLRRRSPARVTGAVAAVGFALLVGVAPALAQSPTTDGGSHPVAAMPAPGATGEPRDGATMPMMDMCRHMMAAPTPGMSADPKIDPKMMSHMLEMRGEMMKAMGEIMVKHGKMMRGEATN